MAFLEYKNFKIVDLCLQGKTNGIFFAKKQRKAKKLDTALCLYWEKVGISLPNQKRILALKNEAKESISMSAGFFA